MTKNIFGTFVPIPDGGHSKNPTAAQRCALCEIDKEHFEQSSVIFSMDFVLVAKAILDEAGFPWEADKPGLTSAQAKILITWWKKTPETSARSVKDRIIGEAAGQGGLF